MFLYIIYMYIVLFVLIALGASFYCKCFIPLTLYFAHVDRDESIDY